MNRIEYETTIAFIVGALETIPRNQWAEIRAKLLCLDWDNRLGEPPHGWDKMPAINTGLRRIFNRYDEKLRYTDDIVRYMGDKIPPIRVSRRLLYEIERDRK